MLPPLEGGRSKRQRFRPLDFWRNERKIYGRRDSSQFACVVDVQVIDKEPSPQPKSRAPKRTHKPTDDDEPEHLALMPPSSSPPPPPPPAAVEEVEGGAPEAGAGGKRMKLQAKKARAR